MLWTTDLHGFFYGHLIFNRNFRVVFKAFVGSPYSRGPSPRDTSYVSSPFRQKSFNRRSVFFLFFLDRVQRPADRCYFTMCFFNEYFSTSEKLPADSSISYALTLIVFFRFFIEIFPSTVQCCLTYIVLSLSIMTRYWPWEIGWGKILGRAFASNHFFVLCVTRTHTLHLNVCRCETVRFSPTKSSRGFVERPTPSTQLLALYTSYKPSAQRFADTPGWMSVVQTAFPYCSSFIQHDHSHQVCSKQ